MPSEKRSFRYQRPTKEALERVATSRGGGDFDSYIKGKYKMFKPRDGRNMIRILPASWENAPYYGYEVYINYQVGADKQSYLSLSKMKKERDPIAEALKLAEREGDDAMVKSLRPTKRVMMWVIDRIEPEEGPQLWPAPWQKVAQAFANLAIDEDTGSIIYVDDPDEGNDIRFHKEGKGLNTEYLASKMKIQGASPLSDDPDQAAEWLEFVKQNPIPDCLQYYSYDHIAAVFNGAAPTKAEAVEEDDPLPRKAAAKPARAIDPEEDPNPEPEDGEPAPKPKAKVAKPEPDEDGEERLSIRERIKRHRSAAQDD